MKNAMDSAARTAELCAAMAGIGGGNIALYVFPSHGFLRVSARFVIGFITVAPPVFLLGMIALLLCSVSMGISEMKRGR